MPALRAFLFPRSPSRARTARRFRAHPRTAALLVAWVLTAAASLGAQTPAAPTPPEAVTREVAPVTPAEFDGDLAAVPRAPAGTVAPPRRPYRPRPLGPPPVAKQPTVEKPTPFALPVAPLAAMPAATQSFAGLSFTDACTGGTCGAGWPPDPNGDVGPNHYVQAVNDAVGIYSKTGTLLAAFTENSLWSGSGANPCNGHSSGDPVVLYDWLADRWVLTWLAFASLSGPFYECIAASKSGDPVSGGWWLYPVRMDDGTVIPTGYLNDYPKFGLWHDCLYMGANEFQGGSTYKGVAFASFSRADLYAGKPLTYSVGFLPYPANNLFSMFPASNLGKGTLAVQPGTPAYYVAESQTQFAFEVRKFTPGPNCGAGGALGAVVNVSQASYTFQSGNVVPQPNTTVKLDMIDDRIMQKVWYRKVGASESLWVTHPVRNPAASNTALQWAQINVTGGTVATTPVQQQIYAFDNGLYRFMGSLAVDWMGDMALGYSVSNSSTFPGIRYAGRLVTDPLGTLPQAETTLVGGGGSQTNNCGGAPCDRWGDYSAMSVDPSDDCTFWYTNEYYDTQANGTSGNWHTRIGAFKFASCTAPVTTTVTVTVANNGPNEVTGARVADPAQSGLTLGAWTCTVINAGVPGKVTSACGAATGTGPLDTTVTLQVSGVIRYTIAATITAAGGTATNRATVTPPQGLANTGTSCVSSGGATRSFDPTTGTCTTIQTVTGP